jgi:hypothetical protein
MSSDGNERPADGSQEQTDDKDNDGRFAAPAVWHEYPKVQRGSGSDERDRQEEATGPPMKLNVAASNPRRELERRQHEKNAAWKNV